MTEGIEAGREREQAGYEDLFLEEIGDIARAGVAPGEGEGYIFFADKVRTVLRAYGAQRRALGRKEALEQQWISVEEKLPDYEGDLVLAAVLGIVYCSVFHSGKFRYIGHEAAPIEPQPSVWQPLPEPPKAAIRELAEKGTE